MNDTDQRTRVAQWLQNYLYTAGVKLCTVEAHGDSFVINKFGSDPSTHANAISAIRALEKRHLVFSSEDQFLNEEYTDVAIRHDLAPIYKLTSFKKHFHAGNLKGRDDKHGEPQLSIDLTQQQINKIEEKFGENKNKFTDEVKKPERIERATPSKEISAESQSEMKLDMNSDFAVKPHFYNNVDTYIQSKIKDILRSFGASNVKFSINKAPTAEKKDRDYNIKFHPGGSMDVKTIIIRELSRVFDNSDLTIEKSNESLRVAGQAGVMANAAIAHDRNFCLDLSRQGHWKRKEATFFR